MNKKPDHTEPILSVEGHAETDLRQHPFRVPEGYFDELTPRLMEGIRNRSTIELSRAFPWKWMAIPSAIAATVVTVALFLNTGSETEADIQQVLATLTLEEICEYTELEPSELLSFGLVEDAFLVSSESDLGYDDIQAYLLLEADIEPDQYIDELNL